MAEEALRAEGKSLFERGRWKEAVAKYGAYIDLLLAERESDGRLVVGYSNQAQTFLQLKMYDDALEDTQRALDLDSLHLKSLVRKAKAVEGLKLYRDAVAVYRDLLDRSDLDASHAREIEDSLRVAGMKDRQTRLGQFEDVVSDWRNFKSGHLKGEEVEEFVGPVELRRVLSEMGRGLFATRDVDPGELLFVSSAIASVTHPTGHEHADRTVLSLVRRLQERVKHATQNLKDCSQIQLMIQLDALAGPYPEGPVSRDVPPMRYFTPVNGQSPEMRNPTPEENPRVTVGYNMDMFRRVVNSRRCTFGGKAGESISGIYCLPSLINHSCLPNVSNVSIPHGSQYSSTREATMTLFFRASCRIGKGEDIGSPLHDRRSMMDIICKCARCVLEERLLEEVPALREMARTCSDL